MPVPGELGGAAMVIDLLLKRAADLGVQIRCETGVTPLVVEGDRVVGVRWKHFGDTGAIKADAVIIAAGGFAMNPDMVAEHTPALGQKRKTKHHGEVEPYVLGNTNDDGLGIRLGISAGGVAKNLDQLFITAAAYPPEILLTGVIVNKDGQRFVAEDSYHSRTSAFVPEQPDQTAYLIVDEAHMQMPEMPLIKFIDGWETVAKTEAALGIPDGKLAATLERYNEHAARGEDPDFHKQPDYLAAQDKGRGPHSICRWAGRCTWASPWAGSLCRSTVRCCARTVRRSPGCMRRAHARPTRPGRQGLCQRHSTWRGLVLRQVRRYPRRPERVGSATLRATVRRAVVCCVWRRSRR